MTDVRASLRSVPRQIWALGIGGWFAGHVLLYAVSPADYWRIVIVRPETPAAHLGSFVTYFAWAVGTMGPYATFLLALATAMPLAVVVLVAAAFVRGRSL